MAVAVSEARSSRGRSWRKVGKARVWRHGVRLELGLLNTLLERKKMRTVQNICVQLCGFME